jgi:hypothetical protein
MRTTLVFNDPAHEAAIAAGFSLAIAQKAGTDILLLDMARQERRFNCPSRT